MFDPWLTIYLFQSIYKTIARYTVAQLTLVAGHCFVGHLAMPETKKLRVAVIGGGVSGLTCTIALLREGVDVHVYEAAVRRPDF